MLRQLTLRRFRSFRAGTVTFANPLVLVGRNGAGKSNLGDALAFLGEAMTSPLSAVCARRGGMTVVAHRRSARGRPANVGFRVRIETPEFGAIYAVEIGATGNRGVEVLREQCVVNAAGPERSWFDRSGSGFRCSVPSLRPAPEPGGLALPLIGGDARFGGVLRFLSGIRSCRIDPVSLRELQSPDGGVGLEPRGGNAASVLREIRRDSPEDYGTFMRLLRAIVPGAASVRDRQFGNRVALEFTQDFGQNRVRFPAYSMSDGALRAVGLLAAVFQRPKPAVLVIEEPEATIHLGALRAVLDLIRHASRGMQVIVTTHSPDVLDAKWIGPANLRVVAWRRGATVVAPPAAPVRRSIRDHLAGAGELMREGALSAEPVIERDPADAKLFEPTPS